MANKHKVKLCLEDKIFAAVIRILLILILLITLYPLIFVISASFSDPDLVSSGKMWLFPIEVSLEGYKMIFKYRNIWTGYGNAALYTVAGTVVALLVTIPCAYAISRKDMQGRSIILVFMMITMYFSGGIIPGYLNVQSLGLVDTRTFMIIHGAVSVYNLIVARTFFASTIPWELHEAARVDGASDIKSFLRIVIPLSKPIIVVLMLYYGVAKWNAYFDAMMYLQDRNKFPLQLILRELLISSKFSSPEGLTSEELQTLIADEKKTNMIKYGVIVIGSLPMMLIYPWLEKFFAKGVMLGSVKG